MSSALPTFRQRVGLALKALVDPQLAGMLMGILPGGRGDPPKRDTRALLEAYNDMPWLRAVSERVADQVARPRWHLYAKKGRNGRAEKPPKAWLEGKWADRVLHLKQSRDKGELMEIEVHPGLDALQRGNIVHTGSQVMKLGQLNLDLVGDRFEMKERNAFGVPVALWNLPPHWVAATPTPARPVFSLSFRGWQKDIPASEILWQSNPDPANPYGRGSGITRSLADELDTDDYAAKFMRNRFFNQARPDLIVSGEGLTPDATRLLEDRWVTKMRGPMGIAKPFFTNGKINVQEVGQTNADLQLVELRKFERDMIIHVFGVAPEVFGILEASNRSTIDAASYLVGKFVVEPRLEARREFLQHRLIPEYDERLVLEYESPIDEDREFQLKVMQAFPPAFQVDDQRELADFPPLEKDAGKVHLVPFGVVPVREPLDAGAPSPPADPGAEG